MAFIQLTKGAREIKPGSDYRVTVVSTGFDPKKGTIRATVRDESGATLSEFYRIGTPKHPNERALNDFSSFVRACFADWTTESLGIDTENIDTLVGHEIVVDVTVTESGGRRYKHLRNYRDASADGGAGAGAPADDEDGEDDVWG